MTKAILTLNAGSSSIKFSLFDVTAPDRPVPRAHGLVEAIDAAPHFVVHDRAGRVLTERRWPEHVDFQALLEVVLDWTDAHLDPAVLVAVGHRVVHGGAAHARPERVTPELLAQLDALTPLAPLHEPHNLAPIRAVAAARPGLPQVACFDTAFHHAMPQVATQFALPREYAAAGVRRYGFHGLSYEFIAGRLRECAPALARGRVIAAHLGNGASLCAMRDGQSVDTTMGFTALDGLMMGTRCGSIDPGVLLYLQSQRGLSASEVEALLYKRSGLLGVSGGISSDMRTLLASPDAHAGEAIALFVFRIVREIGALTSTLGGLDGIVFTAGIGEHAPEIRAQVAAGLGWLGVALDAAANARGTGVISAPDSRIALWVIPTDEEAMIAQHTLALCPA